MYEIIYSNLFPQKPAVNSCKKPFPSQKIPNMELLSTGLKRIGVYFTPKKYGIFTTPQQESGVFILYCVTPSHKFSSGSKHTKGNWTK